MKQKTVIAQTKYLNILAYMWLSIAAAGLIILLVPEAPKHLLVPRTGWQTSGGFFQNTRPSSEQVSAELANNRDAVFWRSWSPEMHAVPGTTATLPFDASGFLVVPYVGYPAKQGIELYLECLRTGERIQLADGDAHEDWVERLVWLPDRWCRSEIRVVASSRSHSDYVGVGSPASASFLSYLKESVFVITFIHLFMFILLVIPGIALVVSFDVRVQSAVLWVTPATLLLGYMVFFVGFSSSFVGKIFSVACYVTGLLTVWLNRSRVVDRGKDNDICLPLALMFLISLGFVLFLYCADNGLGTWSANYRFAPVTWSSDNQLQQIIGEKLYRSETIIGLNAHWKTSDRPPLLAGCFLLSRPLWEPILRLGDNRRFEFFFYQIMGITAMTFWVIPVWFVFRSFCRFSTRQSTAAILILACTPFMIFNSIYIWGKMLAAALALCAYLAIFQTGAENICTRKTLYWLVGGLTAGLALMSHAGIAFGLVPMIVFLFLPKYRGRIGDITTALVAFTSIVLPWALWQHFEEPPGNALAKFAFAGTYGFGEDQISLWQTIWRVYFKLSIGTWLEMRWQAVQTLFGAYSPADTSWLSATDTLGQMRLHDFLFLFPSFRILNFVWPILIVLLAKKRARSLGVVMAVGIAGILVNVLITWNMHIIHHLSYVSILMIFTALAGTLMLAPAWLRYLLLLTHLLYFGIVWGIDPLRHALHLKWDLCAGLLLDSAVLLYLCSAGSWRLLMGRADVGLGAEFQPRQ